MYSYFRTSHILKKTNKGLIWIKWQSNSSFVRKKYPFSEADSNLIRTRLEQMSQKTQKNRVKKKQIDSENSQMMLTKRSQGLLTSCSGVVILLVGFKA